MIHIFQNKVTSVTGIFIIAGFVRFIALNQSLWLDETIVANVVNRYTFMDIIFQFSPSDFHPPLYYLLIDVWIAIFGTSEIALRLPSILFSLLAGWYVYKIGLALKSHTVGFWSSLLFLFHPLIIYYSQEARMYMMVTCFLVIATYHSIRLLKESQSRLDIVMVNLFIGLSFLTFYGSIFYIISLYCYLVFVQKGNLLPKIIPGFLVSLIVIFPLLLDQLIASQSLLTNLTAWKDLLGGPTIKNLALFPIKFIIGRISFFPKEVYYAYAGVCVLIVTAIIALFLRKKINVTNGTLLILVIGPVLLGFIASFVTPLLQFFRFIYIVPILVISINLIVVKKWYRFAIFFIFLLNSFIYLLVPQFHREDWKTILTDFDRSIPVHVVNSSYDPLRYYYPNQQLMPIAELKNVPASETTVYVLSYLTDVFASNYQSSLREANFEKTDQIDRRGVILEKWER